MYTLFLMPRRKPMLTGPNGERRPTFRVAATVSALEEMVASTRIRLTTANPRRIPLRPGW